ncbi:MAG: hypothetical protein M1817_004657 [Caeruleum heppii]|nr:MAG: hypothetical protein M1817_004657 [Caeruleum heppii]
MESAVAQAAKDKAGGKSDEDIKKDLEAAAEAAGIAGATALAAYLMDNWALWTEVVETVPEGPEEPNTPEEPPTEDEPSSSSTTTTGCSSCDAGCDKTGKPGQPKATTSHISGNPSPKTTVDYSYPTAEPTKPATPTEEAPDGNTIRKASCVKGSDKDQGITFKRGAAMMVINDFCDQALDITKGACTQNRKHATSGYPLGNGQDILFVSMHLTSDRTGLCTAIPFSVQDDPSADDTRENCKWALQQAMDYCDEDDDEMLGGFNEVSCLEYQIYATKYDDHPNECPGMEKRSLLSDSWFPTRYTGRLLGGSHKSTQSSHTPTVCAVSSVFVLDHDAHPKQKQNEPQQAIDIYAFADCVDAGDCSSGFATAPVQITEDGREGSTETICSRADLTFHPLDKFYSSASDFDIMMSHDSHLAQRCQFRPASQPGLHMPCDKGQEKRSAVGSLFCGDMSQPTATCYAPTNEGATASAQLCTTEWALGTSGMVPRNGTIFQKAASCLF